MLEGESPGALERGPCCTEAVRISGATLGAAGFVVSVLNAYYVFLKLVKLWELQRTHTGAGAEPR